MVIFNHTLVGCASDIDSVTGYELYPSRALLLSSPGDTIQLPARLRGEYAWMAEHYRRVGIECTREVIWNLEPGELARRPGEDASIFFFGEEIHKARPDGAWLCAAYRLNSKNAFIRACRDLDISTPVTRCYEHGAQLDADALHYPCYLKLDCSASGMGVWRCAGRAQLLAALRRVSGAFQIQEEICAEAWLNVQYEERQGRAHFLATTEQILSGAVWMGSAFPTHHDPRAVADPLARWAVEQGMRGIFAFDVATCCSPEGQRRYVVIEANPRYNGSTYFTLLAARLGVEEWAGVGFDTRHRSLQTLDLQGLLYDPQNKTGVVLVKWGTILKGTLSFLLAGNKEKQRELERALRARLKLCVNACVAQ